MPITSSPNTFRSKKLAASGQKLTMHLFSFKKKDWGEEHTNVHIKKINLINYKKGMDMAYYFHEIVGNKHPELFFSWLLEYHWNVLKADNITITRKVDSLLRTGMQKGQLQGSQEF